MIALELGRTPNWQAARRCVAELALANLDGCFDYWDCAGDLKQAAAADTEIVTGIKRGLADDLGALEEAVSGHHGALTSFGSSPASGSSSPVAPRPIGAPELYDPISSLHAVGALPAVGFVSVYVDESP